MGTYRVTTESGTYEVTTEEEAAPTVAPNPPQTGTEGALRAVAGGFGNILNGLTLGFGDEIVAAPNAAMDYFSNDNPLDTSKPFSAYFDERVNQSEQLRKDFTKENPVVGTFGELAGAVNNPISIARGFGRAGSTLGRIAQETGTGAIQGGIYGAGENENRGANALRGAAVGTLFGAAGGALSEGVAALPEIGARLQRAATGIRQSDIKKAAAGAPKGAPNPLVTAFDNLQEEGVFRGDKSPAAIQERLTERAAAINDELNTTLGRASPAAPVSSPTFTTARGFVDRLKGTDYTAADDIFQEEVQALQNTLDDGGTLQDWQQAKRSLQSNSKYGTDSAELRNQVRTRIASDIRQHIEDVADATVPAAAGDVRNLNQNLSEGLRVDEVLERGKNADLARDPIEKLKSQFRTSGGFGVPMLLAAGAGGGEYNRSGSIKNAIMAGMTGAAFGTRTGKYATGALLRSIPAAITPAIATRAATPFIIKNIAQKGSGDPESPISYFKGGAKGVDTYKEIIGEDQQELDNLYSDATKNYKNFVAPNGKVDPAKASTWIQNNKEALDKLPELKSQLLNPENAQRLIDRHYQGAAPVPQDQVEINALKEFMPYEPTEILPEILKSKNPKENLRQTVAYLRSDKEASAGLRRAATQFLNGSPESYAKHRALLEDGGVFTSSQIKVADTLYGYSDKKSKGDENSTLRALGKIASGSFLGAGSYGQYADLMSPVLKALPPEKFRAKIETALTNPVIARDLMNKANSKNVTRAINTLFEDELSAAMGGSAPGAAPTVPATSVSGKVTVPKQNQVTSKKSFPSTKELLNPPATGSLKKTSLDMKSFVASQEPETRARISVESSGNPFAVSRKGAEGLSQLMPATAQEIASELGETYMPLRPGMTPEQQQLSVDQNVRFGEHYYKKQLKTFKNPTLARAAYNAGPGRVQEAMMMAGSSRDVNAILGQLPKGVRKETIPYVQQIAQRYGNV